jgi:hypothetical protein
MPTTKLQPTKHGDGSGITGFCFAIHFEPGARLFVPPKRYVKRRICAYGASEDQSNFARREKNSDGFFISRPMDSPIS